MPTPDLDHRSVRRQTRDEQIAAEPPLPAPNLPENITPMAMETHLSRLRRPLAVAGVVENGLVRPLDPAVKLPERARVIIVASEGA